MKQLLNATRATRATRATFAIAAILALNLASAAELTVHVEGAKSATGNIMVAVFKAEGFLQKPVKGGMAAADVAGSKVVFADLPEGEYAVTIFHDVNGNGKLDKNVLGIPTEDYAFSNNAMGKFGPPAFDAAKFVLPAAGSALRLSLK